MSEDLSKEQFRELLGHMGLGKKSAALLMYSSGLRIGALLQLKISDLHLNEDPPYADVRAKYTMRRSGRRAHFSYEARDSIEEWLKEKYGKQVVDGEDLLFGYTRGSWYHHWNKACEKANLRLSTHPLKVRVVTHTLRKCFYVNMARAGVPNTILHLLMGLKPDLDTHDPISNEDVARVYKEHMHAVSVHEAT